MKSNYTTQWNKKRKGWDLLDNNLNFVGIIFNKEEFTAFKGEGAISQETARELLEAAGNISNYFSEWGKDYPDDKERFTKLDAAITKAEKEAKR